MASRSEQKKLKFSLIHPINKQPVRLNMAFAKAAVFPGKDVVPEYSFGFECPDDIVLSHEHTECVWLSFEEARAKLKWDSNRTALYELKCRLEAGM